MTKKIVYRVEEGMDRKNLLCTTYQMRNFYAQLRDGFFTGLDIMNYIQHLAVTRMMKKGFRVLDMCCGRNLLLPLMRYNAKKIDEYVGIDIEPKNIKGDKINICNNKAIDPNKHYPFKVKFVIGNVSSMPFKDNSFDLIVYTSSIEHMQKKDGEKSLYEAYRILKSKGILFLSCPNTPPDKDGYDTQYRAHIYEWKTKELEEVFSKLNFSILKKTGLIASKKDIREKIKDYPKLLRILNYAPAEFSLPILAIPFPEIAKEILYILRK